MSKRYNNSTASMSFSRAFAALFLKFFPVVARPVVNGADARIFDLF